MEYNQLALLSYDEDYISDINKSFENIYIQKYNVKLSHESIMDSDIVQKLKDFIINLLRGLMRHLRRFIQRAFSTNSIAKKRFSQVDKQLKLIKHNLLKIKSVEGIETYTVDIKKYDYDKINKLALAGFETVEGSYRNTSLTLTEMLSKYDFGDPSVNNRFKITISDIISFISDSFSIFNQVGVDSESFNKAFKDIKTGSLQSFHNNIKMVIQQNYIASDFEEAVDKLIDDAPEDTMVGLSGVVSLMETLEEIQKFGRVFDVEKISEYFTKIQYNLERLVSSISGIDTSSITIDLPDGESLDSIESFLNDISSLLLNVQSNKGRFISSLLIALDDIIAEGTKLIEITHIDN
jgi:hypothetical protein